METRIKHLSTVKELQDFTDYAVDTEGNVWSFKNKKQKKLSPGWKKRGYGYRTVVLTGKGGIKKNFLVHRLVALCFIPTKNILLEVNHKNRNSSDNRVENLEWVDRSQNMKHLGETNGFVISDLVLAKIKEVHSASIRKGLPVEDAHSFLNRIINGALEEYINQYGLRKLMNTLPLKTN